VDAEHRLLAWNAELARLAGPTLPLREAKPLTSLVAPEMRGAVRHGARWRAGGGGAALGGWRAARCLRAPADRAGLRRGAAARLAGGELSEGVEKAAAARLQSVGALAGGIAHDFNNLLTAIGGSAESALARAPDGDAVPELRQVQESAARGAALVKQLLAFARQQTLRPRAWWS
jgi:two-component system cell cycle sensor histidine kinase/response regulator CckA